VARLHGRHLEAGDLVAPVARRRVDGPKREPQAVLHVLVDIEEVPDQLRRPLGASDGQRLLSGEPAGLHQRHDIGDVVEVVVGQQERVDTLVATLRAGQRVEDAAPAVDQQRVPVGLEEDAGLGPFAGRHRASRTEKRDPHTPTVGTEPVRGCHSRRGWWPAR